MYSIDFAGIKRSSMRSGEEKTATSLAEAARRVEEDGLRRIVYQHHAQDGRCDHRGGEDTPIAYRRHQGRGSEGAGHQEGESPGHEAHDGAGLLQGTSR